MSPLPTLHRKSILHLEVHFSHTNTRCVVRCVCVCTQVTTIKNNHQSRSSPVRWHRCHSLAAASEEGGGGRRANTSSVHLCVWREWLWPLSVGQYSLRASSGPLPEAQDSPVAPFPESLGYWTGLEKGPLTERERERVTNQMTNSRYGLMSFLSTYVVIMSVHAPLFQISEAFLYKNKLFLQSAMSGLGQFSLLPLMDCKNK